MQESVHRATRSSVDGRAQDCFGAHPFASPCMSIRHAYTNACTRAHTQMSTRTHNQHTHTPSLTLSHTHTPATGCQRKQYQTTLTQSPRSVCIVFQYI